MKLTRLSLLLVVGAFGLAACSDDDDDGGPAGIDPEIQADDQLLMDVRSATVARAVLPEAGFVVLYDEDAGARGQIIGFEALAAGTSTAIAIELDRDAEDGETLFAVLHRDDDGDGILDFLADESQDAPYLIDAVVVQDAFVVSLPPIAAISAEDQTPVDPSVVVIAQVSAAASGFVAITQDDGEGAATIPAIGLRAVGAGSSEDLEVSLERGALDGEALHATLHEDTDGDGVFSWNGEAGSPDGPVLGPDDEPLSARFVVSTATAAAAIVLADDQVLTSTESVWIKSVVAEEDGFLVIRRMLGGPDFEEIGVEAAPAGLSPVLQVTLTASIAIGDSLSAVLHEDSDDDGIYDYDGTPGSDDPPVDDGMGGIIEAPFEILDPSSP